mmetsp:Transcript_136652/g.346095  ORF Transcript_136652/g.346095 Transcript_136652/m.346095 type:complete len:292 (+) Transcript_136652:447-1322(+)
MLLLLRSHKGLLLLRHQLHVASDLHLRLDRRARALEEYPQEVHVVDLGVVFPLAVAVAVLRPPLLARWILALQLLDLLHKLSLASWVRWKLARFEATEKGKQEGLIVHRWIVFFLASTFTKVDPLVPAIRASALDLLQSLHEGLLALRCAVEGRSDGSTHATTHSRRHFGGDSSSAESLQELHHERLIMRIRVVLPVAMHLAEGDPPLLAIRISALQGLDLLNKPGLALQRTPSTSASAGLHCTSAACRVCVGSGPRNAMILSARTRLHRCWSAPPRGTVHPPLPAGAGIS